MEEETAANLLKLARSVQRPVFATVSGAHLYGFESPDSDVDLRGAFVLERESMLGVRPPNETVTLMNFESGVELDWVAHDIAKSVRLAARGSGEVLEQIVSPLVLLTTLWHAELIELIQPCINRGLYRHYAGFLASRRRLLEGEHASVKVMLYAYRAALTGIHALSSGAIEAHLPSLLELHPQEGVRDLIAAKRQGHEKLPLREGEAARHVAALDRLERVMGEAHEASGLPEALWTEAAGYAALSDFLLRIRRADEASFHESVRREGDSTDRTRAAFTDGDGTEA